MFRLVKRMKNLKSYMNKVNLSNRNLHEKVIDCRRKLKDIQVTFDVEPHNQEVKMREVKCLDEYNEAIIDEENFISKSKN